MSFFFKHSIVIFIHFNLIPTKHSNNSKANIPKLTANAEVVEVLQSTHLKKDALNVFWSLHS